MSHKKWDIDALADVAPLVLEFWRKQKAKNVKPRELDQIVQRVWEDMSSPGKPVEYDDWIAYLFIPQNTEICTKLNHWAGYGCKAKNCQRLHLCLYCHEEGHGLYGPLETCPQLQCYQVEMDTLVGLGFAASQREAELAIQKLLHIEPWTSKRLAPRAACYDRTSAPRPRVFGDFLLPALRNRSHQASPDVQRNPDPPKPSTGNTNSRASCSSASWSRPQGAADECPGQKSHDDFAKDDFLVTNLCRMHADLVELLQNPVPRSPATPTSSYVLFIAEKPRVAKTIAAALQEPHGERYCKISEDSCKLPVWQGYPFHYAGVTSCALVTSTRGHIFGLNFVEERCKPIDLLDTLSERTVEDREAICHIQQLAAGARAIIECFDADFEGERITLDVQHVGLPVMSEELPMDQRVRRCLFSSLTRDAFQRALGCLSAPDVKKASAVSVRQELDLRGGIPPTRALTSFVNQHASALPAHIHARISVRQLGCTMLHLQYEFGKPMAYDRPHLEDVPLQFWEYVRQNPFSTAVVDLVMQVPFSKGSIQEDDFAEIHERLVFAFCSACCTADSGYTEDYGCTEHWSHEQKGCFTLKVAINFGRRCRYRTLSSVDASVLSQVIRALKDDIAPYGMSVSYTYNSRSLQASIQCDVFPSSLEKHLESCKRQSVTGFNITLSYGPCQDPTLLFVVKNADAIDTFKVSKQFFVKLQCSLGLASTECYAGPFTRRTCAVKEREMMLDAQSKQILDTGPSASSLASTYVDGDQEAVVHLPARDSKGRALNTEELPFGWSSAFDKDSREYYFWSDVDPMGTRTWFHPYNIRCSEKVDRFVTARAHRTSPSIPKVQRSAPPMPVEVRELRELQKTLQPKPLTTTALCQLSSTQLGWSPKQTLHHAQLLYERGHISYPRTETDIYPEDLDCKEIVDWLGNTSDAIHPQVSLYARKLIRQGLVEPRNDGKCCDGHEPIYPLAPDDRRYLTTQFRPAERGIWFQNMERAREEGTEPELTLYELVCRYFLATVSPELIQETTTFYVDRVSGGNSGDSTFKCAGWTCLDKGWVDILPIVDVSNTSPFQDPAYNSSLLHGQVPQILDVQVIEQRTKPPPRITEVELLELMERHGIGTDATMSQHIATLDERGYVDTLIVKAEHEGRWSKYRRELRPTRFGKSVLHSLILLDKELVVPAVRAEVEKDYMKVARGLAQPHDVISQRLRQYSQRYQRLFEALESDKLLLEFLSARRGPERSKEFAKKQQKARECVAAVRFNDLFKEGQSNTAEHAFLRSSIHPQAQGLPSFHAKSSGTECSSASGDCISSDSLAWRVSGPTGGPLESIDCVPLHSVRAGDRLLALDTVSKELSYDAEVGRLLLISPRNCFSVELVDGTMLICTGDHPVACAAGRVRDSGSGFHVATNDMYSKPAELLKRGEDAVCILASGIWIALPLLKDPQPAAQEHLPTSLVNFCMVDDHFKPFIALVDTTSTNVFGIAVGSSPESISSGSSESDSSTSNGSSFIMVGSSSSPSSVSYQDSQQVPLDASGQRSSFGSFLHDPSNTSACYVCWPHRNRGGNQGEGCHYGVLCDRCHLDHPELPPRFRVRRARGKGRGE